MNSDRGEDTRAPPASTARSWSNASVPGRAELGFAPIGIADIDVAEATRRLQAWLGEGHHGDDGLYGSATRALRAEPARLVPGALRVISARMDYLPATRAADWAERELRRLREPGAAVVSLYARGRDYHKVLRARLQQLADAHRGGGRRRSATAWSPIRRR